MKTSIIAVANQKGGVGKTATSVNLASSYAFLKRKTLLIDCDYQGNATANLGLKKQSKFKNLSNALRGDVPLEEVILKTSDEFLDVIAGDMGLSKLSREKILEPGSYNLLKNWLDCEKLKEYEIVIIDTHPSLDLLFQMSMTAAHYYLVPVFAEADPFDGLQYMLEEVSLIKKSLNPPLYLLGIVITKFSNKNATHRKFYEYLQKYMEEVKITLLKSVIPESNAIASSSGAQKSLITHHPKLPVTIAYLELARELLPELRGMRQGRRQGTPVINEVPEELDRIFELEVHEIQEEAIL
jgi:chromosome partitioning protein